MIFPPISTWLLDQRPRNFLTLLSHPSERVPADRLDRGGLKKLLAARMVCVCVVGSSKASQKGECETTQRINDSTVWSTDSWQFSEELSGLLQLRDSSDDRGSENFC